MVATPVARALQLDLSIPPDEAMGGLPCHVGVDVGSVSHGRTAGGTAPTVCGIQFMTESVKKRSR